MDETAEERKGGAGGLAKMLLSAGKDKLVSRSPYWSINWTKISAVHF